MSFEDIGAALRISPQMARRHFQTGMAKLIRRRRTPAIQQLLRLAKSKSRL